MRYRNTIFILSVVVVLSSFTALDHRAEAASAADRSADAGIKTLYRDLGIIGVPRIAPPVDFNLHDIGGATVQLSDFKGKVVFLNFWTTWCPPCRIEMPSMQKLYDQLKHRDFAMVAVDLQEPVSQVEAFVKKFKLSFPMLLDSKGEVGRQFGIRALPTTFILDKEGGIIGRVYGPRDWSDAKAIDLFEHLMTQD
jgi:peroxiredoxin